jgi:hypothetical protein
MIGHLLIIINMDHKHIEEFVTPPDLLECLDKYQKFRVKRHLSTMERDFYVGTEISYHYIEKREHKSYYHSALEMFIDKSVEYIVFSDGLLHNLTCVYPSLEAFLKDFEPITVEQEKFRFKAKLWGMEIIIK